MALFAQLHWQILPMPQTTPKTSLVKNMTFGPRSSCQVSSASNNAANNWLLAFPKPPFLLYIESSKKA
jgi:hypothetical protein